MTPDLQHCLTTCEAFGFSTEDYLQTWFGHLAPDQGSILFVKRFEKTCGGYTYRAIKGFRPDQIEQATKYIGEFTAGDDLFIKTSTFNAEKITARMERGETVVGNKHEVEVVIGIAMDVDAGKRDSYAQQSHVWEAIHRMPVPPTMAVLSGEDSHGFHLYYLLARPIPITCSEDVELLNQRIRSWRDLMVSHVADVLTEHGITDFIKEKLVDRTYGVDRVLRPVGAVRKPGVQVRLASFEPSRKYSLDELTAPGWQPPLPAMPSWPRAEESIIDQYFQFMEDEGQEITINGILEANGYVSQGDGDWIRKESETGSRSLTEGEIINGLPGVNVFSGNCEPLKCGDDVNDVGRRYSLHGLWVAFNFGDVDLQTSWSAAAAHCHQVLRPTAEDVFDTIEPDEESKPLPRIENSKALGKALLPNSLEEIVKEVKAAYGEWPKACRGDLFVMGNNGHPRILDRASKLFGWLNTKAQTSFHTGPSVISKAEFFDQLPEHVDSYDAIESIPHFPPIRGHFYVSDPPDAGNGKTLERFLDFFSPSTPEDRELILALVVTTFWGGAAGSRPLFAIDADKGTGSGKSALAFKIASLTGSCFQFDQRTNEERIRSNLVGDTTADKRMVILDNLKSCRVSNATIETLITSPEIGGHALHRGFRSRPNHLTWVITMNGLAMSRDLAHRTIKIVVTAPKQRKEWESSIGRFIDINRDRLVSDIASFFRRPAADLNAYGRWSEWETAVLARLDNADRLQALIKDRAGASDEDEDSAQSLLEYFGSRLSKLGYGDDECVHIPTEVCAEWASIAVGRDLTRSSVSGMLKMLKESGSLKGMSINPSRKHGRGWLKGVTSKASPVRYDLEEQIREHAHKKAFGDGDASGDTQ